MFLKNKNIIFKIRRSKVTDYAALNIDLMIENIAFFTSKSLLSHINQCVRDRRRSGMVRYPAKNYQFLLVKKFKDFCFLLGVEGVGTLSHRLTI